MKIYHGYGYPLELDDEWSEILIDMDKQEERNNRKHERPDHKYSRGAPISLDDCTYEGEWFADKRDRHGDVEFSVDMERALAELTPLQRRYFIDVVVNGLGIREIARRDGKNKDSVSEEYNAAVKKLQKFF